MRYIFKLLVKQSLFPIILYLAWRGGITLFQLFLQPSYAVTFYSQTTTQRLFVSWTTYWDSNHYLWIQQHGYSFPEQAFFPLWPLLIKALALTGTQPVLASFILTFLLGLSAFILFYLLGRQLVGDTNAKLSLILFAAFPSSMFLLAGYTEPLFLTLTFLSFLWLEKKNYHLAAISAGLSSTTRLVGVATSLAFLFTKLSLKRRLVLSIIGAGGLIAYMIYLRLSFNNPLIFIEATTAWCHVSSKCGVTSPLKPLLPLLQLTLAGWIRPSLSFVFIDWISSMIFLLMSLLVLTKLKLNYFIYTLAVLLLPLASGSSVSMVRYVLVAFPVFFVAPLLIRSKVILFTLCLFLLILQLRFVILFTNSAWVA